MKDLFAHSIQIMKEEGKTKKTETTGAVEKDKFLFDEKCYDSVGVKALFLYGR